MKKALSLGVIFIVILSLPVMASIGKTTQAFTKSQYANDLGLKLNLKQKNLLAFVGKHKELVILKMKKDIIFYERFTWLHSAMPKDPVARQDAYIKFLAQAVNIQQGNPFYDQIVNKVRNNIKKFDIGGYYLVKIQSRLTNKGRKYYAEIYLK